MMGALNDTHDMWEHMRSLDIDLPMEMHHYVKVLILGAEKYAPNNWLEVDGKSSDHRSMHASMFRHLADSHAGKRKDHDSGLDPLLHLAARALMLYTRHQKGLTHGVDK